MSDAIPPAAGSGYRVSLPEFEGPLDLLLHLCKTHEIDIVNIPIAFVTEKYIEYLDVMRSMSVDVAADYLVMAATLAYLKSRELVPTPEAEEAIEDEESALDPRQELIRRLLEYQKYKDAAERLGGRPIEGRTVWGPGRALDDGDGLDPGLAEHSVWKLIEQMARLFEKAGPRITHDVLVDRMSIADRINQLIDGLEARGGTLRFDELIDRELGDVEMRNQIVVTLLALLELARLKVIRVLQSKDDETLFLTHVEGTSLADARRVRVTSADGELDGELDDEDEDQDDRDDGEAEEPPQTQ